MKRIAVVLVLSAAAGAAQAENFDLNVGSRAVQAGFDGAIGRPSSGGQGAYEVGGLFHSQSNADFGEGYVGLKVVGNMGVTDANVDAGIGLRGIYLNGRVNGQDANGEAVALTGDINARLPQLNRVVFTASGSYAPDPLAFGDAHEYAEVALSAGYEVLRNARIYAGYRNIGVDFGYGRHTVDNGFLGGLRLTF